MSSFSLQHIVRSVGPNKQARMILNINTIMNSLFGFLIALTFNDVKDTLIDNVLLKIIHSNINDEKRKIKFLNTEIDLIKILDMCIRLLLIVLIFYLAFETSKSIIN